MKPATFLSKLDHGKISAAIADAERGTSGEIRVFVSRHKTLDPRVAAEKEFIRLNMAKTSHRNGILLYFAPASQSFAVIGDQAIHEKCGEAHWQMLVGEMRGHLKQDQFTEALLHGIQAAGTLLARHFPPDDASGNELPDDVVSD